MEESVRPFRRHYPEADESRPRTSGFFPLWLAVILLSGAVIYMVKYGTDVLSQYSSLLAKLESDHQADRESLANLQQQMDKTSQDLALLAGGKGAAVSPATTARVSEQNAGRGERRVEFELGVNHKKELMPGVSVQVSHTDITRQRYDALLFVEPDRRTWVHDQGVQQLVVFFTPDDRRPRKLVATRVTKYSVIGYVAVPNGQAETTRTGAE
jgi:hypothetical protein